MPACGTLQGTVNTLSELRRAAGAFNRVQELIQHSDPDPSMYGALPPGAWWEVANGSEVLIQPYADKVRGRGERESVHGGASHQGGLDGMVLRHRYGWG